MWQADRGFHFGSNLTRVLYSRIPGQSRGGDYRAGCFRHYDQSLAPNVDVKNPRKFRDTRTGVNPDG